MRTQREELHSAIRTLNVDSNKLSQTADAFHDRVDRVKHSAEAWLRKRPCSRRGRVEDKKPDQK